MSETFESRLRSRFTRGGAGRYCLALVACAVLGSALLLGIAGCGGSSSSSSSSVDSSSSGGSGSSGSSESSFLSASVKQKLDKEVEELEQRPTQIAPTEKIDKPIPPDKVIDVVHCSVEACTSQIPNFEAAAEAVGWKVVPVEAGLTAESIKTGSNRPFKTSQTR